MPEGSPPPEGYGCKFTKGPYVSEYWMVMTYPDKDVTVEVVAAGSSKSEEGGEVLSGNLWLNPTTDYAKTYAEDASTDSYKLAFPGDGTFTASGNARYSPRFFEKVPSGVEITATVAKTDYCSDSYWVFSTSPKPYWGWSTYSDRVSVVWNCARLYIYSTRSSTSDGSSCISKDADHTVDIVIDDTTVTVTHDGCDVKMSIPHSLGSGPYYLFIGADQDSTSKVTTMKEMSVSSFSSSSGKSAAAEKEEVCRDRIVRGEVLDNGDYIAHGDAKAVMQKDGNFVLYHGDKAVWSTGTAGPNLVAVVKENAGFSATLHIVNWETVEDVWSTVGLAQVGMEVVKAESSVAKHLWTPPETEHTHYVDDPDDAPPAPLQEEKGSVDNKDDVEEEKEDEHGSVDSPKRKLLSLTSAGSTFLAVDGDGALSLYFNNKPVWTPEVPMFDAGECTTPVKAVGSANQILSSFGIFGVAVGCVAAAMLAAVGLVVFKRKISLTDVKRGLANKASEKYALTTQFEGDYGANDATDL